MTANDEAHDRAQSARNQCLRLLSARPRTRVELERALAKRHVAPDVAAAVLDDLTEVGLVDDAAFAKAWVNSRHASRGLSGRALRSELFQRGVDRDLIDSALAEVDPLAEEQAATALVNRALPGMARLPGPARCRRLMGLLTRRGYAPGLAASVVRKALDSG